MPQQRPLPPAAMAVLILAATIDTAQAGTIVRMETSLGNIDIELFDEAAPVTVANFLNYLRDGDYDNSFIHRSAVTTFGLPFVIQGGGFRYVNGDFGLVPQDPPIVNEFDPSDSTRSNTRGTIAMAKLPSGPDTATSEWFFNLGNNATNLDNQNGGFTVFGRVLGSNGDADRTNDGPGMQVVDAIAALSRFNGTGLDPRYDSAWTELPLIGFSAGQTFVPLQHLAMIQSVREINHVQRATGQSGSTVTFTVPTPARLVNVTAGTNPDPGSSPAGVEFAEGFFTFDVEGLSPGGAVVVAMQLPSSYRPNTYYMYGPTPDNASPHWYSFTYDGRTGAEFFGNGYVVLHFVDGERGDADLTANGVIADPGGPGITAAVASSSSGGGCALATMPGASTRLDHLLVLLTLLSHRLWRHRSRRSPLRNA